MHSAKTFRVCITSCYCCCCCCSFTAAEAAAKWTQKKSVLSVRKMPDHSGHISPSKGLASIDRSERTAQLSTAPRPRSKSSTNDIEPPRLNQMVSCLCLHCRMSGQRVWPVSQWLLPVSAAEIGFRTEYIVASRRRGTDSIVAFLGGIQT